MEECNHHFLYNNKTTDDPVIFKLICKKCRVKFEHNRVTSEAKWITPEKGE